MPEPHELCGPVLLLAGPGTGKTTRIAYRLKLLLENPEIEPESITLITFTRVAAAEMRARIANVKKPNCFIPPDRRPRQIRTMHSLGMRIILEQHAMLGLPAQPIVVEDEDRRKLLLEDAAQRTTGHRGSASLAHMCRVNGNCIPEASPKCSICGEYRSILSSCSAIDFDDQILLACDVLATSDAVLEEYRSQATHLLVDEYQDINAAQFRLIELLAEGNPEGLFCVGDDDQSIYSFRGGSPEFIRSFTEDFGELATQEILMHSYRCHRHVFEGARAVIEHFDPGCTQRGEYTFEKGDGPSITIHNAASGKQEARLVREIVAANRSEEGVLIIVPRWNYASRIATELRSARIQFSMPGQPHRGSLNTLLTLFEWLADRESSLHLRVVLDAAIRNPKYGVPSSRVRRQDRIAQREEALAGISSQWDAVLAEEAASLWAVLEQIDDGSFLHTIATDLHELVRIYESDDVGELLKVVSEFLCLWKTPQVLADELGALIDGSRSSGASGTSFVRILTQFQAKGLEAGAVCITGLEEGTVPEDGCNEAELAESALRLFVAMTRAQGELHLFHARTRPGMTSFQNIHSGNGPHSLTPSRFLDAVPGNCSEKKYHRADS
ncbi:ATP-dependent helicase [Candidatus Bipolaricaulota bacterium]